MKISDLDMRDAFFNQLYYIAKQDRNVILLSDDFGAPSLDKFRNDLSSQYINIGIAEQNMVSVAAGLALSGKKVYIYAIAPFVTLRCYEQLKIDLCVMNLPVTALGVGSGFAYDSAGPTHHAIEDISIMRALPKMTIFSPSDSITAAKLARITYQTSGPKYIRFDRGKTPLFYHGRRNDFFSGFTILKDCKELLIISTGAMVEQAFKVADKLNKYSINAGIMDIYRLKPINTTLLLKAIKRTKMLVTLEEHLMPGGLGSILAEILTDSDLKKSLKRIGLKEETCFGYTDRKSLQLRCGIDPDNIVKTILKWLKSNRGRK